MTGIIIAVIIAIVSAGGLLILELKDVWGNEEGSPQEESPSQTPLRGASSPEGGAKDE